MHARDNHERAELAELSSAETRVAPAEMAPASRIAARLADLSHAQLVEIAAAGCEASTEVKNRADALLAAHKPLAQWAVEGVLLSSDLVPHLLAPLQLEDGAAAAVCSRWAEGWKATSEGRRRLTRVAFDFPQDLLGERSLDMAVVPGGDELVVRSGRTVRILGRDMSSSGTTFELSNYHGEIAASEEFIYACMYDEIGCFTHAGTEVTKYQMENLQADGGTRTASITGAYIAVMDAINSFRNELPNPGKSPLRDSLAAVSVGIIDGKAYLDLDYELDFAADVDMNVVMTGKGQFVEIQGTGEESTFSEDQLGELLGLAKKGIRQLTKIQKTALDN